MGAGMSDERHGGGSGGSGGANGNTPQRRASSPGLRGMGGRPVSPARGASAGAVRGASPGARAGAGGASGGAGGRTTGGGGTVGGGNGANATNNNNGAGGTAGANNTTPARNRIAPNSAAHAALQRQILQQQIQLAQQQIMARIKVAESAAVRNLCAVNVNTISFDPVTGVLAFQTVSLVPCRLEVHVAAKVTVKRGRVKLVPLKAKAPAPSFEVPVAPDGIRHQMRLKLASLSEAERTWSATNPRQFSVVLALRYLNTEQHSSSMPTCLTSPLVVPPMSPPPGASAVPPAPNLDDGPARNGDAAAAAVTASGAAPVQVPHTDGAQSTAPFASTSTTGANDASTLASCGVSPAGRPAPDAFPAIAATRAAPGAPTPMSRRQAEFTCLQLFPSMKVLQQMLEVDTCVFQMEPLYGGEQNQNATGVADAAPPVADPMDVSATDATALSRAVSGLFGPQAAATGIGAPSDPMAGSGNSGASGPAGIVVPAMDDDPMCVVCLCGARETAVLPCRHLCLCKGCAEELRKHTPKCPVCRGPIHQLLTMKKKSAANTPAGRDQSPGTSPAAATPASVSPSRPFGSASAATTPTTRVGPGAASFAPTHRGPDHATSTSAPSTPRRDQSPAFNAPSPASQPSPSSVSQR